MDRRFEQALSADAVRVREGVSRQYGIPPALLVPSLDPILQAVDDHVLFPISEFWSHKRWIRVSNFSNLMRACFLSRKILEDKTLMLFVMPYMSLKDAFHLYGFVENRGRIMLGSNDEVRFDDCKLPVWGRHGLLLVSDPDACQDDDTSPVTIKFLVINFGLLKSKAEQHERLVAMIKDIENLRCKGELHMNGLLNGPAHSRVLQPAYLDRFESSGRIAQEELLLSTYMNGLDPHDYISDMDTDVHDHIYDHDSDPCDNPNASSYDNMPEDSRARLEEYMNGLMTLGRQVTHPKKAELQVLSAEGDYDAETVFTHGSKSLEKVLCNWNKELYALIADLKTADDRYSLIGVKGQRMRATQDHH